MEPNLGVDLGMPQHRCFPLFVVSSLTCCCYCSIAQDMVDVRRQLQDKFKMPLARLPFDEHIWFLQQMSERRKRNEKLKASKKKGKSRTSGSGTKKRVNEALSDMSFSLAINGADVFTLNSGREEVIELTAEDEKQGPMEMPKVPGRFLAFTFFFIQLFFFLLCLPHPLLCNRGNMRLC